VSRDQEGEVEIAGIDAAVVAEIERETSELLARLIRVDTSNPPGNETAAAQLLDDYLRPHGLAGQIVGEPPERRSFVLRLDGSRPGPTLLLLCHLDVVPAEAESWTEPPFAGVIKDDYVWGRGAIDNKNLAAAYAVAVRRLAAQGADFAGSIVLAATADEEEGSVGGANWLLHNRPDLMRADYVLNEGGGAFMETAGRRTYELDVGEKGTAQFRLTVHGDAGHASAPVRHGNAVVDAAKAILALQAHRPKVSLDALSPEYIAVLVDDPSLRARLYDVATVRDALDELHARDEAAAYALEPLYGLTFAPTVVHSSGAAVNVYPQRVVISVDCRIPVGYGEAEARAEIEAALAGVDARWEIEWIGTVLGNASIYPSPYGDAIARTLTRLVPGAVLAQVHSVGFADSNYVRSAQPDAVVYCFAPSIVEEGAALADRFHGVDERIHVRDLAFQAIFAEQLVKELLR
jgi:acetylornithine deacetylase/succinyl-diaminopimelate desuccinylase-like protein